jgi:hypothetical protein
VFVSGTPSVSIDREPFSSVVRLFAAWELAIGDESGSVLHETYMWTRARVKKE